MQINNLKRKNKNKKNRIVGRGGKHAKTSGRGGKGQTARAGNKRRPELRDIIKKLPKKRGYRFNSFKKKIQIISLDQIALKFPNGGEINPNSLLSLKLFKKAKGKIPQIKILKGKNDFKIKIMVTNCLISSSAEKIITEAGGEILKNKKINE